jgi:hypothetical protein
MVSSIGPLGTNAVLEYTSCQVPTAGTAKVKFKILVNDRAKFRRICLFSGRSPTFSLSPRYDAYD